MARKSREDAVSQDPAEPNDTDSSELGLTVATNEMADKTDTTVLARIRTLNIDLEDLPLVDFSRITNIRTLPKWLGISAPDLKNLLGSIGAFYHEFYLPKKMGGVRRVYKIDSPLKSIQKLIARSIKATWEFDSVVHGYVKGRSVTTNAKKHLAARELLHLDLQGFFDNIKREQVEQAFRRLGAKGQAAATLAQLCTYRNCLPQGAASSPILSNMIAEPLDQSLAKLAKQHKCRYTRYGDDLTFSSKRGQVLSAEDIEIIVEQHGFALNHQKTKIQRRGSPQYVCGLTIFDDKRPRIPRRLKDQLRTHLYFVATRGLKEHITRIQTMTHRTYAEEVRQLFGLIAYVTAVERRLGMRFRRQYKRGLEVDRKRTAEEAQGNLLSRP